MEYLKQIDSMKIFLLFVILIFSYLLISCSKGDLIDKSKSNYYYLNSKSEIFFKSENAPDVTALWDFDWIKVPADEKSFVVIDKYFARDKQHYFHHGKILDVDYNTFVIGYNGLLKDKNHVYRNRSPYQILKEANPATFERIIPKNFLLKESEYWSKDDKNYFMEDEIMKVDFHSFKFINPYFFVDDNSIYYRSRYKELGMIENKNLPNADFTVLDMYIIHTDDFFYFYNYFGKSGIIEIPIKDPATIIMYSKRDYFSIDNIIYSQGTKVQNADLDTFETFEKGDAVWFAKDKNHVYKGFEIIEDAHPNQVTYNKKEQTIEDGTYIWRWNDQASKYLKEKKTEEKAD